MRQRIASTAPPAARGQRHLKRNAAVARLAGKVKRNVAVTYAPTGGDPSTQSVKVKLKKTL